MEANDELVPLPDSKGFLDLTSRAWVNLDPVIWTMNLTLVTLDISYNHINYALFNNVVPNLSLLNYIIN